MQEKIIFSGFGGQGVMFVGQLLAYTAMESGLEVTWIPSYGPEMRGGTAHCCVVISDRSIGSPVFSAPDVAVVFNIPSHEKYERDVVPGGLLVSNASLIASESTRTDITELRVPASEIATGLGNVKLTNIVLLGAVLANRPVLSIDSVRVALDQHIPEHRRSMLALNLSALDRGARFVYDTVGLS
jgi:2-oxoglutarate ferredoxin oxidoreductase subunit gamma